MIYNQILVKSTFDKKPLIFQKAKGVFDVEQICEFMFFCPNIQNETFILLEHKNVFKLFCVFTSIMDLDFTNLPPFLIKKKW